MKRLQGLSLASIGIAIIMPHLVALGYHPFSFEVLSLSLIAGMALFAAGLISNYPAYLVLTSIMAYWFADSYFLNIQQPYLIILALILFVFAIGRFSQKAIPILAVVYGIGFTAPTFLDFPDPVLRASNAETVARPSAREQDFAFLHIILDEAGSPLAIPESAVDADRSQEIFDDYQSAGFMVHGLAMSEGRETLHSLGGIFGLSSAIDNYERPENVRGYSYALKENRLVKALFDQGFDVSVIQSNYLALCAQGLVVSCETYTRGANMSVVARSGRTAFDRLTFALAALHDSYLDRGHIVTLYGKLVSLFDDARGNEGSPLFGFFSRSVAGPEILRDVSRRIRMIEPGQAIIAHVMFPHFPYVLDGACEMKGISDWAKPLRYDPSADIDTIYRAFVEQDTCAHSLVMELIKNTSERDDLIVIVHGDHGSRIALGTPFESDEDTYGTFLAIKAPNVVAGLSTQQVSLQGVFNDYFNALIAR